MFGERKYIPRNPSAKIPVNALLHINPQFSRLNLFNCNVLASFNIFSVNTLHGSLVAAEGQLAVFSMKIRVFLRNVNKRRRDLRIGRGKDQ